MAWLGSLMLGFLAVLPVAQAQLMPTPHSATCFLDIDGDAARGLQEPVYLQGACPSTAAGDVRLSTWTYPGGTILNGTHDDAGLRTILVATTYAYFDADGGGTYSLGDPLYLAFGPIPGPLRPGDLPLTGRDAFNSLQGDDSRIGHPLRATAVAVGGESYAEHDGNPGYTTGDIIYLDLDANGQTSLGDLRLATPTQNPPPPSPTSSPSQSSSSTSTPSGSTNATSTTDQSGPGKARSTPPVALGIAMLALAIVARRSH